MNQINNIIWNALVFPAISILKAWNRFWHFVSIFIVLFSKGKFELEPVWQDSILLPNHLSWQRQWNQKSSSLWLHLPCKCCQKIWFSPVAKLYPETIVIGTQTVGAYTQKHGCPNLRRTGTTSSLLHYIQWLFYCLSNGGDVAFWFTGFQDFCQDLPVMMDRLVIYYLDIVLRNYASGKHEGEYDLLKRHQEH